MTETKFTPGPWFVRTLENFGWNIVHHRNGDRHDILRVAKVANKTDAHLIAAAPELLAACEAAEWNSLDLPDFVVKQLRDAIAKARGES